MKIILAYSGGLDTAVALHWLRERYQAEVIPFCANLGQKEDIETVRANAYAAGASRAYFEDLRDQFARDFLFRSLRAGAAYEGQYLLAAPLSRPLIAKRLVEIAIEERADAVAHGATGKGNDQVRFYSSIVARDPARRILAPVIDWELESREAEYLYAKRHGIPLLTTGDNPYSIDTNLWGSSVECGPLDDLERPPGDEVYQLTTSPERAPDRPEDVAIEFESGQPVAVDGHRLDAVPLIEHLNGRAGRHGVGRIDIVENRLVGIKTRGVYESPAGTVLHRAHRELESVVLDRDTLHYKESVARRYAELVYYGLWFSPLREALDAFVDHTQHRVTGRVVLRMYKGSLQVISRVSNHAQYVPDLSTYEKHDTFDHKSGAGFAYVWSMPLRIAARVGGGPGDAHRS